MPPLAVLKETERQFLEDVAYLKLTPGPALCINLLLCHDAGKPLIYDPYTTSELMNVGRLSTGWVTSALDARSFAVVQLGQDPGSGSPFPPYMMPALRGSYSVSRTGPTREFYTPRRPPERNP